jgi:hypothetical protein
MEAIFSSKTQGSLRTTRRYNPEDNTLLSWSVSHVPGLVKHHAMKAYGKVEL